MFLFTIQHLGGNAGMAVCWVCYSWDFEERYPGINQTPCMEPKCIKGEEALSNVQCSFGTRSFETIKLGHLMESL